MATDYTPLWHWVREREDARLRKENGEPFPWATDDIINTYRFCNVRREDDRVTVWVRKNIREAFADNPNLWLMLCMARQINWPGSLGKLISAGNLPWPVDDKFEPPIMAEVLDGMDAAGEKVWTGAYIIPAGSTKGEWKTASLARKIAALWKDRHLFERYLRQEQKWVTMRGFHEKLMKYDGWGPFLAYQAVVDMRFTPILSGAADTQTWAAAGPGTIRGLNRIHGRRLDHPLPQSFALGEMKIIHAASLEATGVAMDFTDVPNILCETDKYLRVKNGEGRPRALYVPGRGS